MQLGTAKWAPARCELFSHTPFLTHTIDIEFCRLSFCIFRTALINHIWSGRRNKALTNERQWAWQGQLHAHLIAASNNNKSTPRIAAKKSNLQNARVTRSTGKYIYSSAVCRTALSLHLPISNSCSLLSYFTPTSSSSCSAMNANKFSRIVCPKQNKKIAALNNSNGTVVAICPPVRINQKWATRFFHLPS